MEAFEWRGDVILYFVAFVLAAGVLFWSGLAFFAARKMFLEDIGPLVGPARTLARRAPMLLPSLAIVGPLAAVALVVREVVSIQRMEGYAGGSFMFAVVLGIVGAFAIAAHLFLDR